MSRDQKDDEDLPRQIGERLVDIREQRGVTRRAAAAAIGVSVQTYINREKGTTELKSSEVIILADIFRVDVTSFFEAMTWEPPSELAPHSSGVFKANEAENFVRLLARIPNERIRRDVADAVKAIARANEVNDDSVAIEKD